ncbi:MAG: 4Fe-4S dicluster domain-containing protein [Deltaproteobacteria bacterium]|nr:4Fe-4S dicluster domain-containing protein [Deltaproteobacteria bacterium]
MVTKIFTKEEWVRALKGAKDDYRIYLPVKHKDFHAFELLSDETAPDFEFQNTRLSPKSLIFPQSERMFEYSLDEKDGEAHIVKETPKDFYPQAVVGIRPCDAHALQLVNVNFDNPQYKDPWWVKRLESTILVGLGCNEPCSTCFCTSVGGGPFSERGLDVILHDLEDVFLVKPITQKGETFINKLGQGRMADDTLSDKAEAKARSSLEKVTSSIPTGKLRDKVVTELFEAPFWEEVAFACINCGTCTYLCPTCWCFDIQDEVLGKEGDRIRNWDSCMSPLFTLEGSGHNPRSEKCQRVRQRFMHKLKYYVDKYEDGVQCSGCGRCVRYCPVNIDIRHVAKLMNDFAQ